MKSEALDHCFFDDEDDAVHRGYSGVKVEWWDISGDQNLMDGFFYGSELIRSIVLDT